MSRFPKTNPRKNQRTTTKARPQSMHTRTQTRSTASRVRLVDMSYLLASHAMLVVIAYIANTADIGAIQMAERAPCELVSSSSEQQFTL